MSDVIPAVIGGPILLALALWVEVLVIRSWYNWNWPAFEYIGKYRGEPVVRVRHGLFRFTQTFVYDGMFWKNRSTGETLDVGYSGQIRAFLWLRKHNPSAHSRNFMKEPTP